MIPIVTLFHKDQAPKPPNHQLKSGTEFRIPCNLSLPSVHPHQTPQLRFLPAFMFTSYKPKRNQKHNKSDLLPRPKRLRFHLPLTIKLPYHHIPSKKGYGTCSICSCEFEFYFVIINFNVERIKVEIDRKTIQ